MALFVELSYAVEKLELASVGMTDIYTFGEIVISVHLSCKCMHMYCASCISNNFGAAEKFESIRAFKTNISFCVYAQFFRYLQMSSSYPPEFIFGRGFFFNIKNKYPVALKVTQKQHKISYTNKLAT